MLAATASWAQAETSATATAPQPAWMKPMLEAIDVKQQLQRDPESYPLVLKCAYLSFQAEDYVAANEYYLKAARLRPQEETPLEGLFYTALKRRDPYWPRWARAILKMDPSHRDANLALASDAYFFGKYNVASRRYARLLRADPSDQDALVGLAWSEFKRGEPAVSRMFFQRVLSLHPEDVAAREGLLLAPQTLALDTGLSYASIRYRNVAFKSGGSSWSAPVSLAYKDRAILTITGTRTILHYSAPLADQRQDELRFSGFYRLTPRLAATGSFEHVSVNDPKTNDGKIGTAGAIYTAPLYENRPEFISLGGWGAYSRYPSGNVYQWTPHAGVGTRGVYVDLSMTGIANTHDKDVLNSTRLSLTLGPWKGFVVSAGGYRGLRRMFVEDWGSLLFNSEDVYRGGWRTSLSWTYKAFSPFVLYGRDTVRTTDSAGNAVDFSSTVAAAGLNARFGWDIGN